MKTHLVFCCNKFCRDHEIDTLIKTWGTEDIIERGENKVIVNDTKYIFIIGMHVSIEKIHGYLIDSYYTCGEVFLSDEVLEYLESHKGENK